MDSNEDAEFQVMAEKLGIGHVMKKIVTNREIAKEEAAELELIIQVRVDKALRDFAKWCDERHDPYAPAGVPVPYLKYVEEYISRQITEEK